MRWQRSRASNNEEDRRGEGGGMRPGDEDDTWRDTFPAASL